MSDFQGFPGFDDLYANLIGSMILGFATSHKVFTFLLFSQFLFIKNDCFFLLLELPLSLPSYLCWDYYRVMWEYNDIFFLAILKCKDFNRLV